MTTDRIVVERRRLDAEWKRSMERDISALREEVTRNTILTEETKVMLSATALKLDATVEAVQPVLDAMDAMEVGIKTIGRIGEAGTKVLKFALLLGAVGVFAKVLWSTGSVQEAMSAFGKFTK